MVLVEAALPLVPLVILIISPSVHLALMVFLSSILPALPVRISARLVIGVSVLLAFQALSPIQVESVSENARSPVLAVLIINHPDAGPAIKDLIYLAALVN